MSEVVINTKQPSQDNPEVVVNEGNPNPNGGAEPIKDNPPASQNPPVVNTNPEPEKNPAPQEDDEVEQFLSRLAASYKQHGSVKPILQAMSHDYAAMDDIAIEKLELQQRFPNVTGERFERLFKKEVLDRYYQGEGFDDEDVELGKELLKSNASKTRSKLVEEQKQFLEPKLENTQAKQQEVKQKYQDYVNNSEFAKKLNESKIVAFSDGENAVNIGVDPQKIIDATINNDLLFQAFSDGNGGIKWDLWGEVIAHALFPNEFKSAMSAHYGSKGVETKITDELKNSTIKIVGPGKVPEGAPDGDFRSKLVAALQNARK